MKHPIPEINFFTASEPRRSMKMRGIHMRVSLLLSLIVVSISAAFGAAPPESALEVSVAIPFHNHKREIGAFFGKDPHFHVIVRNASDNWQRIWGPGCHESRRMLSFEITDENGKTWTVTKNQARGSPSNYVDYWELAPHESLVIDVQFNDPSIWDGFPPLPKMTSDAPAQPFQMRAVFEIRQTQNAAANGVWTGRVVSKMDYYFLKP